MFEFGRNNDGNGIQEGLINMIDFLYSTMQNVGGDDVNATTRVGGDDVNAITRVSDDDENAITKVDQSVLGIDFGFGMP